MKISERGRPSRPRRTRTFRHGGHHGKDTVASRRGCGVLSFHLLPAANLVPAVGQTAFDRLAIGLAGGPDGVRRVGGSQHHAVRC